MWIGLIIIVASMYQCLSSYLQNSLYQNRMNRSHKNDVALEDADVMDGYIPTSDDKRKKKGVGKDTIKRDVKWTPPKMVLD